MLKYLILFFVSFTLSLLLTPLIRSFAIKIKAIDLPGAKKKRGTGYFLMISLTPFLSQILHRTHFISFI